MIVLSNCLTKIVDEGGLKLATSLVTRLKEKNQNNCLVIAFEREFSGSDVHLQLNKFHISKKLVSLLRKMKQPLLYIPFPAQSLSMAIRIFLLSLFARKGFRVVLIRQYPMNWLAKFLLNLSKAELVVFSQQAKNFYNSIVRNSVIYIKTGIDTQKFQPVSEAQAKALKEKYGFDPEKPLILHVGHMKPGRNVKELLKIGKQYQVLLVISTLSKERQDENLRALLEKSSNICIMDEFIPNIEEIYQLADLYFFPVCQVGYCIDVPLSCLEAAACNKPVVTTDYGEMKAFLGQEGFNFISDFQQETIQEMIEKGLSVENLSIRTAVLPYDWNNGIDQLIS